MGSYRWIYWLVISGVYGWLMGTWERAKGWVNGDVHLRILYSMGYEL